MGDLSFAEMKSLVKRAINNRSDMDTEIEQAINSSIIAVASQRGLSVPILDRGPQAFSTVVNETFYAFTSIFVPSTNERNVLAVYSPLYDTTNKRKIKVGSIEEMAKASTVTAGKPVSFLHWYNGIKLYPQPDAVYSIYFNYRQRPSALSAGTDTSLLPPEFDFIIVWAAASDLNAMVGNLDKSAFYATKKLELLNNITPAGEIEDATSDFSLAPDLS